MGRDNITFDLMVRFVSRMTDKDHWIPDSTVRKYVNDPNGSGGGPVGLAVGIYATYVGEVPVGFAPKSTCGIRVCVRPSHLVLVSSNSRRSEAIDMRKTADTYRKICNFWVEPT